MPSGYQTAVVTSTKLPLSRIRSLDALRGLAAIMVVLYHARERLWIGLSALIKSSVNRHSPTFLLGCATAPLRFGYLGVELFMVLSGYCIYRPYAPAGNRKLHIGAYLRRRVTRLHPTLLLALAVTWICDKFVGRLNPTNQELGNSSFGTFVGNLLGLQPIIVPHFGSNLPLFSLGTELQLYIIFFGLFAITRWRSAGTALGVAFTVTLASHAVSEVSSFPRPWLVGATGFLFSWTCGFMVAHLDRTGALRTMRTRSALRAAAVLGAIGIGIALVGGRHGHWSQFLLGPAFALIVAASVRSASSVFWSRPSSRFLAWVGTFSYTLYATHYPLLVVARVWLLHDSPSPSILVPFVASLGCVAAAFLLFQCVERWTLVAGRRLAGQPEPSGAEISDSPA